MCAKVTNEVGRNKFWAVAAVKVNLTLLAQLVSLDYNLTPDEVLYHAV